jgi:hypothetical protein
MAKPIKALRRFAAMMGFAALNPTLRDQFEKDGMRGSRVHITH